MKRKNFVSLLSVLCIGGLLYGVSQYQGNKNDTQRAVLQGSETVDSSDQEEIFATSTLESAKPFEFSIPSSSFFDIEEKETEALPLVRGTILQHYTITPRSNTSRTTRGWIAALDLHDAAIYNGLLYRWVMYDDVQTYRWYVSPEFNVTEPYPAREQHKAFEAEETLVTSGGYSVMTNFVFIQAGFRTQLYVIPIIEKDVVIVASEYIPMNATNTGPLVEQNAVNNFIDEMSKLVESIMLPKEKSLY